MRACSFEARGLWREMVDWMHDGEPYGHLTAGGVPIDAEQLARIVGISPAKARTLLRELEDRRVFSRTEAAVIYSRRMVKDEHNRNVRAAGGGKSLENPNVPRPKDGRKDADKDGAKDTFLPSFGGSPAVAVGSLLSAELQQHGGKPPEQNDRAEIWSLIRAHFYVPDGQPPAEWTEARDGSILRELAKHHTASDISAAIQGERARATADIKAEFKKAMGVVTVMEGILAPKLESDPVFAAQWRAARRVTARIGRPRKRRDD